MVDFQESFKDEIVGKEASKLFKDAQEMLIQALEKIG